ncbi:hypothetical protein DF3PA_240020 [Candidatus Defluviicoccus seviourii]|uniref:Uncharacterized protein n=1 Tax=Candidatus Defluviicoccus seviourii TaxID=2565273 RepID=A0A564WDM1_9PROT|nr:hypothetical protein DF3PA_240020 [Candidatus Defluviicoccus seviourii]
MTAKTEVPRAAMAAAAWSCVEKILQDAQRTSAPRACSVSISTAVWMVMCREPAIRAPRSGRCGPNSSRQAIKPGISVSAISISLRPHSARAKSFTTQSVAGSTAGLADAVMTLMFLEDKTLQAGSKRYEGEDGGSAIVGAIEKQAGVGGAVRSFAGATRRCGHKPSSGTYTACEGPRRVSHTDYPVWVSRELARAAIRRLITPPEAVPISQ